MLPKYVEIASRMYRVLWLVENVLREYLETGDPAIVTTAPVTRKEAVAPLLAYIAELHQSNRLVSAEATAQTTPDRASKPRRGDEPLKNMQREAEKLGGPEGLPPPSTAISRKGRPLDFVFLRFLSAALSLRNPDLHRQIADELTTLKAYRNAVMHFRDIGPAGFDHACSLTWRICHALSQDEQCGLWIGQWFGTAADPRRIWPKLLATVTEDEDSPCVDYGDFAVPPIGRFRPFALHRGGCVLFPGGLYKARSSWTRIDPAWVAQRAAPIQLAATDRIVDAREYECWILPEVKAARMEGDDAIGPSGLHFRIGRVERRRGTSSARTGFVVSRGSDGPVISDGIPAGHGDFIRSLSNVSPKRTTRDSG
jgi:hypothetical protein